MQTGSYSKYRLDANDFFDRRGAWSVALAPAAAAADGDVAGGASPTVNTTESAAAHRLRRREHRGPLRAVLHDVPSRGDGDASFELYRPFQPFSTTDQRKELIAYMTASSDPRHYGQLIAYEFSGDALPEGPNTIGAAMVTDPKVSEAITLLSQTGLARSRSATCR